MLQEGIDSILPPNEFRLERYTMNAGKHWSCLIINNLVDDSRFDDGVKVCMSDISRTADHLGFANVSKKSTRNGSEILAEIADVAARSTDLDDCVAVFIISHGERGGLIVPPRPVSGATNNGNITIEELKEPLLGSNCPNLLGRPKMFFILACRGDKSTMEALNPFTESSLGPRVAVEADFLIYQSTVEGYKSFMSESGSVFIKILCDALRKYASSHDLLSTLTLVSDKVQLHTQKVDPANRGLEHVHMPSITSTLRKRVYLGMSAPVPLHLSSVFDTIDAAPVQAATSSGIAAASGSTSGVREGLLTDAHRYILRKQFYEFSSRMQKPEKVVQFLFANGYLSKSDVDDVNAKPTRSERVDNLMDIVFLQGDGIFSELVAALKKTGQYELARRLDPDSDA